MGLRDVELRAEEEGTEENKKRMALGNKEEKKRKEIEKK